MRLFAIAIAIAMTVAGCLAASAAQAEIDTAFGNTVVSRYPDGAWVKHWFNPDGTYQAHFSDGRELVARWTVDGDRVCLSQMRPSMLLPRFCTPLIEAEVGETWRSRDPLGRTVQNVLQAGR
ncbi:hypothetical protein [uncultured Brevundimonas sp.]|uniref:hypothetical protein n=1 Tax=uncultured Brevundimonas sp. TaxID=213418 RepID=UPI0030EF10DC|tara:strand:+ start:827 stop:1192 length:366 start_codon:yes stop_codon:yes gene_type:complete